jgi:SNF family Na+-dependent transporter
MKKGGNHMIYFLVIIALILIVGLFVTFGIGKRVSTSNSEFDDEIDNNIRRHPVLLNPVFLAYIIAIGAVLVYIFYLVIT